MHRWAREVPQLSRKCRRLIFFHILFEILVGQDGSFPLLSSCPWPLVSRLDIWWPNLSHVGWGSKEESRFWHVWIQPDSAEISDFVPKVMRFVGQPERFGSGVCSQTKEESLPDGDDPTKFSSVSCSWLERWGSDYTLKGGLRPQEVVDGTQHSGLVVWVSYPCKPHLTNVIHQMDTRFGEESCFSVFFCMYKYKKGYFLFCCFFFFIIRRHSVNIF